MRSVPRRSSWSRGDLCFKRSINRQRFDVPVDINILEFIASYWSLLILLQRLPITQGWASARPYHIHLLSDNTSNLSWMRRHSNSSPLILFLLQELSRRQWESHVLVTFGFIKGEDNIHADAESRNFNCPNGEVIRIQHQLCLQLSLRSSWKDCILRAARTDFTSIHPL